MKTTKFTSSLLTLLGILVFSIGGVFALGLGFRDLDWGFGWKLLTFILGWGVAFLGQRMMAKFSE